MIKKLLAKANINVSILLFVNTLFLFVGAVSFGLNDSKNRTTSSVGLPPSDVIPPSVTSFTRQNPMTSLTNQDALIFRVIFSEDVQNVGVNDFKVVGPTGANIINLTGGGAVYDLTVVGGDLANLNGTVGLDLSATQYIRDLAGNVLPTVEPGIDETYTLDNKAPLLLASNIATNGSTLLAVDDNISLIFDENIALGTGNIQIIDLDDDSHSFTIDVAAPNGQVTVENSTLIINPDTDLDFDTNYAVQVAPTAITDIATNSYLGVTDNTTLRFKTVAETLNVFDTDEMQDEFIVYPNPVSDFIKIEGVDTIKSLQIADVTGKVVLVVSSYTAGDLLDTSSLIDGVYFITVKTDTGATTKKIIKKI